MKSLLSAAGIAGMIAVSSFSYAQDSIQKINARDVPVPKPEQIITMTFFESISSYSISYDTDGDNFADLQFLYGVNRTEKGKDVTKFFSGKPFLLTVDLDRNHEISDDEVFKIDYTNSQPTNPLAEKSFVPETKEIPKDILEDGKNQLDSK